MTLDADFHALLAFSQADSPSVIRIRIQGLKGDRAARIIQQVVDASKQDLVAGAAVTVNARRISIRRLPLITGKRSP